MDLHLLEQITEPLRISDLDKDQVRELQTALLRLGYSAGPIDGLVGAKTMTAWSEFKSDTFQSSPTLIGPGGVSKLKERVGQVALSANHDFTTRQGTIDAIKAECIAQGIGLPAQIAYVLATVEHETADKFQPVKEAFYLGAAAAEHYLQSKPYYPYYGRGYVQLTWKSNYQKYSDICHVNLVDHPENALDPTISLFILVHGFRTGGFTGKKITDYIGPSTTDFIHARRCINGLDSAAHIASLAQHYLSQM